MENRKINACKIKKIIAADNGYSWLFLILAISFMMSVFAPLEAFFANRTEFWFELKHILPSVIIVFCGMFAFATLFAVLVRKVKSSYCIYSFLFTFMMYFYIQGNYVPRNYGVLNGTHIEWEKYTAYAIISIAIFLISVVMAIIFILKLKEKVFIVGKLTCVILILLQLVTLGTLFVQNYVFEREQKDRRIVTTEEMFNLSKEENVIVFVLDTFDSLVMQDMLGSDNGDEYEKLFNGFTYYQDTVGAYPTTKGALPQLLTGQWYENNIPYDEYIQKAYIKSNLYSVLDENDFSTAVYTNLMFMSKEQGVYDNVQDGEYEVASRFEFTKCLYSMVAFNYMPHQLKKHFYITTEDFSDVRRSKNKEQIYSEDVLKFYNTLLAEGISSDCEKKAFRFYHLQGIHAPYTFDKNLRDDEKQEYNVYDEASGNFKLLELYFNELKSEGIWDNTTIVIMGDHGYMGLNQNPLFMIKNAKDNEPFSISSTKMSYGWWMEVLTSLLNGISIHEDEIEHISINKSDRNYMYYTWDHSWDRKYLPRIVEYISVGEAMNYEDMRPTGRVFDAEKDVLAPSYVLGNEISFGEANTAKEYCLFGFSESEGEYTWTTGKYAAMMFVTEPVGKDLQLSMTYTTYMEKQRVRIYIYNELIADFFARGTEESVILIPKEYVQEGEILLKFEFPDATSPASTGDNQDNRILALAMHRASISCADEGTYANMKRSEYKYELNTEITFHEKEMNASKYLVYGFGKPEGNIVWTNGKKAELLFDIGMNNNPLMLEMSYHALEAQKVIVSVNGKQVEEYIAAGSESKKIFIPSDCLDESELHIVLEFPNAVSPAEKEINADRRVLALALCSIRISEVEVNYYELGTELTFDTENTAGKYIVKGFSVSEGPFTWTIGNQAELLFGIEERNVSMMLEMNYFTRTDSQHVIVLANGNVVDDFVAVGNEEKRIMIPMEYLNGNELLITINLPDAVSGVDLGDNGDMRELSLAMRSIKIFGVEE